MSGTRPPFAVPVLCAGPGEPFPDPNRCLHPDGLVAVGGDLEPDRIKNAYCNGIFPWYEPGGPILWWSPDPRAVLIPGQIHVPRRLARTLRQERFEITINEDFEAVIDACANERGDGGTWITADMRSAYLRLHRLRSAHSLEVRCSGRLVGGVYGVAYGRMFFAESKFHRERDASKVALVALMDRLLERRFVLCDCQLWNPHLEQFGVRMVDRADFVRIVRHTTAMQHRTFA